MSEGLRRPEGLAPWAHRQAAPGKGPHPLRAAFADLGWRPANAVAQWLDTLPRETTVEEAIRRIPPHWIGALGDLGYALRQVRPMPWTLLQALPPWAAHGEEPGR